MFHSTEVRTEAYRLTSCFNIKEQRILSTEVIHVIYMVLTINTGCTQNNGAVSEVNKKFLTLYGHNVHRQQRQLSKFLMRYQQFASHAYCGASFQDGVAEGKRLLCVPF